MLLSGIREELVGLNQALPENNLVVWTSGNVSVRDPESGLVVIKPSGVLFSELTAESMVIVDLEGNVVEGSKDPSSDTASHLYVYRHRDDINGIAHTHSNYATAFAALGMSIPAVLTAIGDEFGGPIPCGDFALIGGEQIGEAILEAIGDCPAILLKNHGVFTVGRNGRAAVKAAIMVEDVAKTVWLALQLGDPCEISNENLKKLNERYTQIYGQH